MMKYHLLEQIFTQDSIQDFRIKELLMFFVGYAIRELIQLCSDETKPNLSDFSVNKLISSLIDEAINSNHGMKKQKLYTVFIIVLKLLEKSQPIFKSFSLSFQQLFTIFSQVLLQGLENTHQKSSIQIIELHLEEYLTVKMQVQTLTQPEIKDLTNQPKTQHFESLQITLSKTAQQKLCEICCFPISNFQNNKIKTEEQSQIVEILSCNHQYHRNCMVQTIKSHLNQNSSIIQIFTDKQQKNSQNQEKKDPLTLIKCPGFQNCNNFLQFSQLHQILLKLNQENVSQQIQKLHSIAFNDYLNQHKVRNFEEIREAFNKDTQLKEPQQEKPYIFFCRTKGCNAIYQIDNRQINETLKRSCSNLSLQNFTCLSCQKSFCLKCFSSIHPTMTCKQFSISQSYLPQDRELQKFIKTLRRPYMKCPKCHFYVDNWRGCSTITCRCGIRFCYKCGSTECPYAKCLKEMEKQAKENKEKQQKNDSFEKL